MKKQVLWLLVVLLTGFSTMFGQGSSPAERKAFREYTSPDELVSIAPTATMDKALAAISEVSKKFVGKIIVDTEHRNMPINVDIQGMQWRDALEAILRKNDLWYTEYENYIQITGPGGETEQAAGRPGAAGAPVEMQKEPATFRSREVKLTAVFLEVDLATIEESGIDWTFMKSTNDYSVNASFDANSKITNKIFKVDVTPKISFANINLVAQIFSTYNLGEILSNPQIIVRSGEEGRIQVGQDFSVRERDFAGNLIDKFYSAGTIVKVRPQVINEQGVNFIHIIVEAERSNVTPGTISTIIDRTKANTNLLLLDGEETVIGGLYSNETSTIRTGIPFLKDLPWYVFGLRYIFGYDKDQVTKKELVILMKAELVPTLQERITQRTKQDGIFERWLEQRMKDEQRIKQQK